ncbi:hypothetical protein TEK04_08910 [Klenkia sp. LSe6-5]|uniref:Uncharacterized protein n=1 Tax=Klenkia sesuvii TaxID=3103137 RepID=A0ABU8DSL3_9ACTN
MRSAPLDAPPRPDLDWLLHRTRRTPASAAPTPRGGAAGSSAPLADFLAGRTTRRRPDAAPAAPTPPPAPAAAPSPAAVDDLDLSGDDLDLSAPAAPPSSGDLDLSAPTSRPTPPAGPPPSGDLDLFPEPAAAPGPAQPQPSAGSDLDLFPEPAAAPGPAQPQPPTPAQPPRPAPVVRTVPRVAPGGRVILTPREPVVVLDRLQSGIGALTVTAVCSPAVGDLVLGVVYQLADGFSGVVSRPLGIPTAPPRTRRPVLEAARGEFEQVGVDLRQVRSLRRFVVWATSASESELAWGGTLRVATHGGSRVEIPLDVGRHAGPLVIASVHVLEGELVVRAELDPVRGVARDVARAHGYGAITWADARTPVL